MSAEYPGVAQFEVQPDPPSESRCMTALEALAVAKAHFVARGWRPVSIQPPALVECCNDVSAVLLINDASETAWLSSREWSMVSSPADAFRMEMACVHAAKVAQAILVYDGEFPEAVVDMAARQPSIKLVDAAGLQGMSCLPPPTGSKSSPVSRRARLLRPARDAVASVHAQATRMVDAHLLPATERFVSRRLAQALREVDGERRRLHKLASGVVVLMGLAFGFLLFNLAVLTRAPDEAPAPRLAATVHPVLPAPMPPAEGYVARAAGVGSVLPAARIMHTPPPAARAVFQGPPPTLHATASDLRDADVHEAASPGLDDYALSQMRADEAMRVIAHRTPEIDAATRIAADWRRENAANLLPSAGAGTQSDPAMVDGDASSSDPAGVD